MEEFNIKADQISSIDLKIIKLLAQGIRNKT